MLPILKPTEKCWQPQDFLPHPEAPEFLDAVRTWCLHAPELLWLAALGACLLQPRACK